MQFYVSYANVLEISFRAIKIFQLFRPISATLITRIKSKLIQVFNRKIALDERTQKIDKIVHINIFKGAITHFRDTDEGQNLNRKFLSSFVQKLQDEKK